MRYTNCEGIVYHKVFNFVVWTQRNIERNLGPLIRDHSIPQEGLWSYIDIYDLADAIVLSASAGVSSVCAVLGLHAQYMTGRCNLSETAGHEVLYIAAADNIGGRDMAAAIQSHYGDAIELRELARPDASGISCAKAKRMLGWEPKRSWRDYLDEHGHAKIKPGL